MIALDDVRPGDRRAPALFARAQTCRRHQPEDADENASASGAGWVRDAHDVPGGAPRVEYELTAIGRELLLQVLPLWAWIADNINAFKGARKRFGAKSWSPKPARQPRRVH